MILSLQLGGLTHRSVIYTVLRVESEVNHIKLINFLFTDGSLTNK